MTGDKSNGPDRVPQTVATAATLFVNGKGSPNVGCWGYGSDHVVAHLRTTGRTLVRVTTRTMGKEQVQLVVTSITKPVFEESHPISVVSSQATVTDHRFNGEQRRRTVYERTST